ncbi:unnamed protein product, partial [Anisakis simplex]|uniref:ribonuclease H n=1 Tax=Anisakis simplex TaxID=6269 RepID=A0A0M3IZI3_ANISI
SAPTVYCDGAYDWNRGKAGIGVFWGPADSRNLNLSLTGDKVTNIRAEIQAVNIAILQAHRSKLNRIYVKTDCAFVVKVINLWLEKWRLNSWKKASGAVVENVEDIKRLSDRLNLVKVRIEHIYGHQKVDVKKLMAHKDQIAWRKLTSEERDALGNHESDRLAQLGIDQPMMSDTDFESLTDAVESAS